VIHFLDTSVLTKRYAEESGSSRVRELFRKRARIVVSRVTFAEICAALARKERDGEISRSQADAVFARLVDDFRALTVIEVRGGILDDLPELVRRHPLRGYDAVQLACALAAASGKAAVTFWCSDRVLVRAAAAEGLRTTQPG
jgi:predicted nucleic acid-binding protein